MSRIIRMLVAATAAGGLALFAMLSTGMASAETTTTNSLSYEFDNGAQWLLQKNAAALSSTMPNLNYADVGIVVDLGPASQFTGLTWTGTGSLAANIWLGDGPDAYTPGTHLFPYSANFSYGPYGQTFWFGPQAGHTADAAYISGLGSTEIYAWIGVVYSGGSSPVSGSVSSVNGHAVGNRVMSITPSSDGTSLAVVIH